MHGLVAVLATWPLARNPLSRMIGHPDGDVWNHAWGPWWFWEQLSSGRLPWHCSQLYGPDGGTLWFIDPIAATLGAPLVPILGVAGAWNTVILAGVFATSWAARDLASRVTGPGRHTWLASVALVFGPYLNGELHNGISEATLLAPSLLSLGLAWTAFQVRTRTAWLQTAAALGLTFLGTPYYALAAGVAIAVLAVPWLWSRPSLDHLRHAASGAVFTAVLVAPLATLIRRSVGAADALVHRADPSVASLIIQHNAVDPRTFVAPLGFQSVDYSALGEAFLHSGYVGWTVLILAGFGWRRSHRTALLAAGLATLLLALGPRLIWGDGPLLITGRAVTLPFAWLQFLVPVQAVTHTLRLAVPGLAVLAVLAAEALRGRPSWMLAIALLVVPADLVFGGGSAWPLARTPALDTTAQQAIAAQPLTPAQSVVLDLPGAVGNTMATSRYLVLQSAHGRPIPYRPDARASSSALVGVPTFKLLALASEVRPEHRDALVRSSQNLNAVNRDDLVRAGVSHVVVHRDLERGSQKVAETEQLLTLMYGPPQVHGDTAVYTVSGSGPVALPRGLRDTIAALPTP